LEYGDTHRNYRNDRISNVPSYTDAMSGGWPVSRYGTKELETSPFGRCDVLVLDSPVSKVRMRELILSSTPVLLRGAALNYKIRQTWTKKRFLERHSRTSLRFGVIPYADVFKWPTESVTVAKYVNRFEEISQNATKDSQPVSYMFGADLLQQAPQLRQDFEAMPPVLEDIEIGGRPMEAISPQFFLGPPTSGAPMHFHKDAVNVLAYGRKRWFLHPPRLAHYAKRPTVEWMRDAVYQPGGALEPLECVQEAGDVLYVPNSWGHATLNIESAIGVSYEFGIYGTTAFAAR